MTKSSQLQTARQLRKLPPLQAFADTMFESGGVEPDDLRKYIENAIEVLRAELRGVA